MQKKSEKSRKVILVTSETHRAVKVLSAQRDIPLIDLMTEIIEKYISIYKDAVPPCLN
jgi:hypothetical protein